MPTREYIPARFVSSVARHQAPLDALTADSTNWLIRPAGPGRTKAQRRKGQTTPTGWDSVLNTSWTGNKPRGRQLIGMRASQLTDKSQHPTALFTDDEGDKRGEVVTYDSDNTDWYSLGHEYSTTHYPTALRSFGGTDATNGAALGIHFRWCPLWTNGAATSRYVRGITASDRQLMFAGGRSVMESGEWLFGMSDATPWMWRKTWNYATGSGTNVNRLRPWGHQVPLYVPKVTATGGTSTVSAWVKEKVFYYSVAYLYDDGAIGPFTPISDSVCNLVSDTTNTATRGRMTVTSASNYYVSMVYTNIPRGPKGVIGRVLARTAQVDTASTSYKPTYPGANDLRIITIIHNNTQTTYTDTLGDDETLIATPDLVRIDHKWPSRGKYLVANNKRFLMCGSLKPNPAAIIIAPTGITASRDVNQYGLTGSVGAYIDDPDDQRTDEYLSTPGTRGFYVELTGSALKLYYDSGSGSLTTTTIDIQPGTNYLTLQAVVDLVNQTLVGGSGKEWAAQLAPGVDGDILINKIAPTTSSCAVGDALRAGGAGLVDYIWVRGQADPAVLYFTKAYMDSFPTDDQAVEWTLGGPSDTPSIMNWSASNITERKPGDAFVGRCLGAAPIGDSFAVFYERGIYRLASVKEGGADEDVRLIPVTIGNVHVVADSSIFWGDGFAGCMTHQGIFVMDEAGDYRMISGDVFDSEEGSNGGEWYNEILRSLKATQAGGRTTADDEPFCYAAVLSDQLHVSYRKSATAANDRRMVYDFSANAEAKGLAAVLNGGQPWGWSTPLTNTVGAMVEIADQSGGMVRYGIVENVAQGRIDKFDTGTTDNGSAVTATGYFATDFMDTLRQKQASQAVVLYAKNGSGLSLVVARDQGSAAGTHSTDTYTTTLATSGDDLYIRKVVDLTPEARTPSEVYELRISDDGSGECPEVWRVALSYSVLDFSR